MLNFKYSQSSQFCFFLLSAQAATVFNCCDQPACCDASSCCN